MRCALTKLCVGASIFAASFAAPPSSLVHRADAPCHNYVIISARGTTEPQGPSFGFKNTIAWTLGNVTDGVEYDVVYPADAQPSGPDQGAADALRYLKNGLQSCPQQRYALLGYSQGATVILKTLKNITGTSLEDAVYAVYLIGNPFQVPGQISTVDQKRGASTRDGTGSLLYQDPSLGLSQHYVESGKVLNLCYAGDSVCNGIKASTLLSPAHFAYITDQNVQGIGAQWLVSHLTHQTEPSASGRRIYQLLQIKPESQWLYITPMTNSKLKAIAPKETAKRTDSLFYGAGYDPDAQASAIIGYINEQAFVWVLVLQGSVAASNAPVSDMA